MKKYFEIAIIAFVFIFINACKKKKTVEEPIISIANPTVYKDFSKLKAGNYWVYQYFEVDTLGNATPYNKFDSCYFVKDTMIHGSMFAKVYRPTIPGLTPDFIFIRDSLHYQVNHYGEQLFSSVDFTNNLSTQYWLIFSSLLNTDTASLNIRKMTDINVNTLVPAGTFTTLNSKLIWNIFPKYTYYQKTKYQNTKYAENIGIVAETLPFYFASIKYTERRLIRYKVN